MKRFVLGDPHGGLKSMLQCFERCNFNYEEDELICLGDTADGWPDVYECIEELLKIKNLIYVLGNHDEWLMNWLLYNDAPVIWTGQGGFASIGSYNRHGAQAPQSHIEFLKNAPLAYVDDEDNILFVHGGIDLDIEELAAQHPQTLIWDRELIERAVRKQKDIDCNLVEKDFKFSNYKEIYVGHTTTFYFNTDKPIIACNVIDLDTGGGYEGKLTIMDRDTKQYWQSDNLDKLYPNVKGRR